jgi:hypothetical protein
MRFTIMLSTILAVTCLVVQCRNTHAAVPGEAQTRRTIPGYSYGLDRAVEIGDWEETLKEYSNQPMYFRLGWIDYIIEQLGSQEQAEIIGPNTWESKHSIESVAGRAAMLLECGYGFDLPQVSRYMSSEYQAEVVESAKRQCKVYKSTIKEMAEVHSLNKSAAAIRSKYQRMLDKGTEGSTGYTFRCRSSKAFHRMLVEYMPIGREFAELEDQVLGRRAKTWDYKLDKRESSRNVTGEFAFQVTEETGQAGLFYVFYVEDGIIRCIKTLPLD